MQEEENLEFENSDDSKANQESYEHFRFEVDPGQTVAASFSAPELFKIAGDLSKIKIDAAIVESDVSGLDAGDPVTFSVDAYPGRVFRGSVNQLRLKSQTQSNIVTYTAVVDAANTNGEKVAVGVWHNRQKILIGHRIFNKSVSTAQIPAILKVASHAGFPKKG